MLVEAALILSTFLVLVIGIVELSLAVWQYNTLAEAARAATREAIVHGELAPPRRTVWGPATFVGTADDAHEIAQAVRRGLAGVDPSQVAIEMTWPEGTNEPSMPVRCTVSTQYRPALTSIFTRDGWTLSATSTMGIAH